VDRVCPLLGLQQDRRTAIDGVDRSHCCYAEETPMLLDRQQQARLCLTADHERCERYLANATRNGGLRRAQSGIVDGLVSTRLVLAPDPAWRGIAGRARRTPTGQLLAIGAAGVAIGIGGVAIANGAIGDPFADADVPGSAATAAAVDGSPSPTSVSSATASATSTPTTSATPSPVPTAVATPVATAVPAPAPTVVPTAPPAPPAPPAPQETYVVQDDDTLAAIAQRFGTTVAALQAANGIEDADEIIIGQVLVIP